MQATCLGCATADFCLWLLCELTRRQPLAHAPWAALQVSAALRKLAAQLKEMEGPASSGTAAAAKGSLSSSDSDSDAEDVVNTPNTASGTAQQQQQPADVEQLQSRRSGQLQLAALRLVKELLTQGGGKTD